MSALVVALVAVISSSVLTWRAIRLNESEFPWRSSRIC